MSIQQTKKQSDLEKRLRLLHQQVYGKSKSANRPTDTLKSSESFRSDITYLYQDLRKILVLSSIAIGAQVILFVLAKNHIVNFF